MAGALRRSGRGAEAVCPTHLGTGSLLSSLTGPLPSKAPPRPRGSFGAQEAGKGDQKRQGKGPFGRSGRGEEGICPAHSSPGSLLSSQVRSPQPLRQGVGGKPGPLLFLAPKPHPPQPPGPFPALGVLSIGPTHCPNLTLAYAPPSTAKVFPPFFFFLLFLLYLLLWYQCTFWLLIHLYFYFYILSNISVSFLA